MPLDASRLAHARAQQARVVAVPLPRQGSRLATILRLLEYNGWMTAAQIAADVACRQAHAAQQLKQLCERGLAVADRSRAETVYRAAADLRGTP